MCRRPFARTPARVFRDMGCRILGWETSGHHWLHRYRRIYGAVPLKLSLVWDLMRSQHGNHGQTVKDLLWTFHWFKNYGTEENTATTLGTTDKTLREHLWPTIELIESLDIINWEQRKVRAAPWNQCRVSVDGTDFRILEQWPFNKRWYSHKYEGPAVRYELAISISTGWIVWVNGPFAAGEWPDLRIVGDALNSGLEPGEYYIADGGYWDGYRYTITPTGYKFHSDRVRGLVRAQHENINRRFKQWGCLQQKWRHSVEKHGLVFRAIANIIQIGLMTDEPAWDIHYDEREFGDRFLMQGA